MTAVPNSLFFPIGFHNCEEKSLQNTAELTVYYVISDSKPISKIQEFRVQLISISDIIRKKSVFVRLGIILVFMYQRRILCTLQFPLDF